MSTPAQTARDWLALNPLYLDTETTGLSGHDEVVQIAIIDSDGNVLLNALVNPRVPIGAEAASVHGITSAMLGRAAVFDELLPAIQAVLNDRDVVIYNADFDVRMMAQSVRDSILVMPCSVHCAMKLYAQYHGDWNPRHRSYRWQSLESAARRFGIDASGAHDALADARITRQVLLALAKADMMDGKEEHHETITEQT